MSSRLSTYSELLPSEVLSQLLEKNIRTVADFIFTPAADILRLLPRGTASLGEINDCISRVTAVFSAAGLDGEEAYEAEIEREKQTGGEEVRSGVKELDHLMSGSFGGASGGRVVELSGESGHGTGKTALALHIVLSHLSAYERASSVWLDTTGDLSAERITRAYTSQKGPAVHSALERFHISLAFDIDAAYQVLDGVRTFLASSTADQPRPRIVVIDSITPFLGPQLSAVTSQGHATMVTFMRSLRSLAQAHSLCIIVINTSSSANPYNPASAFSTTARKPALGPSFMFLTDVTLWMAHPPALTPASTASDVAPKAPEAAAGPSDPGSLVPSESLAWDNELRVVEIFRSRVSQSNMWCTIRLRNGMVAPSYASGSA